jgi:hypothetical protein
MKYIESDNAIFCRLDYGPIFGSDRESIKSNRIKLV